MPVGKTRVIAYAKGLPAMTIADKIEDHQARCQPQLLRLRMIARDEPGTALTWQAVTEIVQATEAILAEAQAAGSDARAAAGPGAATFLNVRLSRARGAQPTTRSSPPGTGIPACCAVTCTGSRC